MIIITFSSIRQLLHNWFEAQRSRKTLRRSNVWQQEFFRLSTGLSNFSDVGVDGWHRNYDYCHWWFRHNHPINSRLFHIRYVGGNSHNAKVTSQQCPAVKKEKRICLVDVRPNLVSLFFCNSFWLHSMILLCVDCAFLQDFLFDITSCGSSTLFKANVFAFEFRFKGTSRFRATMNVS